MTLEQKFEELELQVGNQHTELMAALSTIAYALGAPPIAPTITLTNISAQLTALNNNLIGIAIANGSFYSALLSALATMTSAQLTQHNAMMGALDLINVNTDTLINNSSLNAQRILSAILATACACSTTVPFLESPLDVTPTTLADEAKCRRIQFYLSIFGAMVDGIANYGGAGAMVTAAAITEIMYAAALSGGLVGAEVGVVAGPPGIALGAIVGIIGAAIGALGSSYLFTLSAQWHTAPLYDQLLVALYNANSADEGTEAFYAVINASEVLNLPFKPLLNALWWNDWSNEIYSGLPVVDDSAFDGSICGSPPEEENCQIYDFVGTTDHYYIARFNPQFPGSPEDGWNVGNYNGWRFTLTSSSDAAEFVVADDLGNLALFNTVGQSVVISRDTDRILFQTRYNNTITAGTYEVCPPGAFIP